MQCNRCGALLQGNDTVCLTCGQEVGTDAVYNNSGIPNQPSSGQVFLGVAPNQPQQNQWGAQQEGHNPWGTPSVPPPEKPPRWLKTLAILLPILAWVLNVTSVILFMSDVGTVGFRIGVDLVSAAIAASGLIIIVLLTRKYQGQKMGCFLAIAVLALVGALGNAATEALL